MAYHICVYLRLDTSRQSNRRLLHSLLTHLLRMRLRIKLENPIFPRKLNQRRVLLHRFPISVMPLITRRLTRLLHRLYTLISDILIRPQGSPHITFARLPQQHRKRDAIFQRLRRALCARRQEGMRRVAEQADATVAWCGAVATDPVGQRVTVYEFPIDEFVFGSFGYDFPAHGVPAFEDLFDVFEVAREGPGLVDVVLVAMREDPAAVGAAFEG